MLLQTKNLIILFNQNTYTKKQKYLNHTYYINKVCLYSVLFKTPHFINANRRKQQTSVL